MLLTEYNEAEAMELFREDGRAEGLTEGRAEGLTEGRAEDIYNLMKNLGMSAEQALDAIGVPEGERALYLKLLSKHAGGSEL